MCSLTRPENTRKVDEEVVSMTRAWSVFDLSFLVTLDVLQHATSKGSTQRMVRS